MSEVKVNKISPRSGTTVTLGDSGDTITLASGVSLTGVNATFSGNTTIGGNLTVDTNTFFIDSVNNIVRVGDNSSYTPNASADDLIVGNTTSGSKTGITILSSNDVAFSRGSIYFADSAADSIGRIEYNHGTSDTDVMKFFTNTAEAMRIDSSGNVGIGTSSPDSILHLYSNNSGGTPQSRSALIIEDTESNGDSIQFLSTDTGFQSIFFGDASDNDVGRIAYSHSGDSMRFNTNGSEAMRIDSSGNLLVGKTADNFATVGTAISQLGEIQTTRASATPLYIRRNTSDGELIGFYKDGNAVGSIGTRANQLGIGSSDTGLEFNNANDRIQPFNMTTNNTRDNAIDLGGSEVRFRHLYMGGNIYLGGTGSANALDDYEEGTWTPNFTYTTTTPSFSYVTRTGRYTKIGRMVMIQFSLNVTSINTAGASGEIEITGLPFTCKSTSASAGAVMVYGADVYANAYDVTINVQDNSSNFRFIQSRDNEGWINMSTANDAGQLIFQSSFVYDTDS